MSLLKFARRASYASLLITFASFCAANNAPRSISGYKTSAPPVIDGKLDDEVWKQAPQATEFYVKHTGELSPNQTKAWIAYDDKAIYIAFECSVASKSDIVANEIRPGVMLDNDDFVAFRFDHFFVPNDQDVTKFQVSARGTQNEVISGGRAAKREWRGEWSAATTQNDSGYLVEIRIPWAILNYKPSSDSTDIRINFSRWEVKAQRATFWSNIRAQEQAELNGIWKNVSTPKNSVRLKAQFLPYVFSEYLTDRGVGKLDGGLDFKIPFNNSLSGIGSVNPDFNNVEQAVESTSFTRSERFLSDSRPFFAEGANYLGTTFLMGIGSMFYSRRIRDFDYGTKVYGRLNPKLTTSTLMTFGENGERIGAFQFTNQTDRETDLSLFGTDHQSDVVDDSSIGVSGIRRIGSSLRVLGEAVQLNRDQEKYGAYSYATEYRKDELFGALRYINVSNNFSPSLGYVPFNNIQGWHFVGRYNKNNPKKQINRVFGSVYLQEYQTLAAEQFYRRAQVYANLRTLSDNQFEVSLNKDKFLGIDEERMSLTYTAGVTNRNQHIGAGYQFGRIGGDRYRLYILDFAKRIGGKIDLSVQGTFEDLGGVKTEQTIYGLGWEINAKQSLAGRVVQNNRNWNAYLAYRSSGFAGNELFIILGDPNSLKTVSRLVVKYVIPIGL